MAVGVRPGPVAAAQTAVVSSKAAKERHFMSACPNVANTPAAKRVKRVHWADQHQQATDTPSTAGAVQLAVQPATSADKWQMRASKPNQDRMFCPDQFQHIQAKLGRRFTLDACCNDSGDNRLVQQYCSPGSSFLDRQLDDNDLVWINPPFNCIKQFVGHYKQQKAQKPSLSAAVVTPDWITPDSTLVQDMLPIAFPRELACSIREASTASVR